MTTVTGRPAWTSRTAAVVGLVGLAVFGCGTDDDEDTQDLSEDSPVAGDEQPDPDPEKEPDEGANGDGSSPDEDIDAPDNGDAPGDDAGGDDADDLEPVADGGDTEPSEAEGESPGTDQEGDLLPQAVTDVRVASHDGFDRVVLELESDGGTPGWFIEYDHPTAQGSGNPVEVDGDASLTVLIHPVTLPPDLPSNVQTWEGDSLDGPEGGLVQQVVGGSVYEGYHQFFVGLDQRRPFAVERLVDPPRIVIDLFREQS